jgi:hypothetical protein
MGNTIFKIGHEEIADISNPIMQWTTILKIENKIDLQVILAE